MNAASEKALSLYWEIRAFFYAGVLSLVWGIGVVVRTYSADWGVIAVMIGLGLGFAAGLAYCFFKAPPFSRDEVPSPNLAYDYPVAAERRAGFSATSASQEDV